MVLEKAEKGISGSKVSASKRDVIQELRSEASRGNFDILLVYLVCTLGGLEQGDGAAAPEPTVQWTVG